MRCRSRRLEIAWKWSEKRGRKTQKLNWPKYCTKNCRIQWYRDRVYLLLAKVRVDIIIIHIKHLYCQGLLHLLHSTIQTKVREIKASLCRGKEFLHKVGQSQNFPTAYPKMMDWAYRKWKRWITCKIAFRNVTSIWQCIRVIMIHVRMFS